MGSKFVKKILCGILLAGLFIFVIGTSITPAVVAQDMLTDTPVLQATEAATETYVPQLAGVPVASSSDTAKLSVDTSSWQEFSDPYWAFHVFYPQGWTLQNVPYRDFGWRISSPDLMVDALGRPLKGGYFGVTITPSSDNTSLDLEEEFPGKVIISREQTSVSSVDTIKTYGSAKPGLSFETIEFENNGWTYKLEVIAEEGSAQVIIGQGEAIVSTFQITGQPSEYPYESMNMSTAMEMTIPAIKHAFSVGGGRIAYGYGGNSTHQGSNYYSFDIIECSGSVGNQCYQGQMGQLVIAPTDMKLIESIQVNADPNDPPDYHIFEVAKDDFNRLCMALGHFYIMSPNLVRGATTKRGNYIGQLASYSDSYPHIHMGLWYVPLNEPSGCFGNNRSSVPFNGPRALDGNSYDPGPTYNDSSVTSTNAGLCIPIIPSSGSALSRLTTSDSLSDCWYPSTTTDNAQFITDVTVPDGEQKSPGQTFTKTWRLKNTGSSTWGSGYVLAFVSGQQMNGPSSVGVPYTAATYTADISVNLTAPGSPGSYTGYWRMRNPQGLYFGDTIWVTITLPGSGGGDPQPGGSWSAVAWQNRYLAGTQNWQGTFTWSNGYPYISFDWGNGSVFNGWSGDNFSMRIWRDVYFPGGSYSFYTDTDDGVRVWIDGNLMIDGWWDGRNGHSAGRSINVGNHEVRVEYYENTGNALFKVWWYGPGYPQPDTQWPDGRITKPVPGSFTSDPILNLAADAWDDISGVDYVEFYVWLCEPTCSWVLLGTDYSAPYQATFDWSSRPDYYYTFTLGIRDKSGKYTGPGSTILAGRDTTQPSISIVSPTGGATLHGSVTINASGSDTISGIGAVQFFAGYNDGSGNYWHEIGWDKNNLDGWSLAWDTTGIQDQNGVSVFVYAYDLAGNYQSAGQYNLSLSSNFIYLPLISR